MSIWLGEVIISLVLIVMGIIFYTGTLGFSASVNPLDIGPAAFPRLMISFMILAAAAQIVLSFLKHRKNKEEAHQKLVIDNKLLFLCSVLLLGAYALLMPVIGYYIVTPVFVFLVMLLMGNRKWVQMVLVSLGFTLFAYLVFFKFLKVYLP